MALQRTLRRYDRIIVTHAGEELMLEVRIVKGKVRVSIESPPTFQIEAVPREELNGWSPQYLLKEEE